MTQEHKNLIKSITVKGLVEFDNDVTTHVGEIVSVNGGMVFTSDDAYDLESFSTDELYDIQTEIENQEAIDEKTLKRTQD